MRLSTKPGLLKGKILQRKLPFPHNIKLDGVLKWTGEEKRITTTCGIVLKFQDVYCYPTYAYMTKKDPLYLLRKSHPADIVSAQTPQINETYSKRQKNEKYVTPLATATQK